MAYIQNRQDSSGTLKTTISLGRTPAIVHSGPFYLMKEPPEPSELTGSTNLLIHHHLNNTYTKLSNKKKNELSAYLHHITDVNNSTPNRTDATDSTLQSLLEKRIIGSKEILQMTATQLIGFRLHPGALPPQYRIFTHLSHKKQKKHKKKQRTQDPHDGSGPSEFVGEAVVEKKKKDKRKEKKKDKKDKKEKKRKTHGTEESVVSGAPI